jgi:hypothetical protein
MDGLEVGAMGDEQRDKSVSAGLGLHTQSVTAAPVGRAAVPVARSGDVESESPFEFAFHVHSYIRENIAWADQKAAFTFVAVTGMLAVLENAGVTKLAMAGNWSIFRALSAINIGILLASAGACLATVWPRLAGNRSGVVFWLGVAKTASASAYAQKVKSLASPELSTAVLEHCHELSLVCRRKYKAVNWAVRLAAIGLAQGLILLALTT